MQKMWCNFEGKKWIENLKYAEVAQLVEHFPEEEGVAGSSPALGTRMVSLVGMLVLLEKLDKRNTRESCEGSRVGLV